MRQHCVRVNRPTLFLVRHCGTYGRVPLLKMSPTKTGTSNDCALLEIQQNSMIAVDTCRPDDLRTVAFHTDGIRFLSGGGDRIRRWQGKEVNGNDPECHSCVEGSQVDSVWDRQVLDAELGIDSDTSQTPGVAESSHDGISAVRLRAWQRSW